MDYKTAELGNYRMNLTTAFIDFFAKIGWAYDLKTVSKEIVESASSVPATVATRPGAGATRIRTSTR